MMTIYIPYLSSTNALSILLLLQDGLLLSHHCCQLVLYCCGLLDNVLPAREELTSRNINKINTIIMFILDESENGEGYLTPMK